MGKRERERGTLYESGASVPRRLVAGYGISAAVPAAQTQTPCSVQRAACASAIAIAMEAREVTGVHGHVGWVPSLLVVRRA